MAKMTGDEGHTLLRSIERFYQLERQATDEVGWIALRYSVGRAKAQRLIDTAREFNADGPTPQSLR